MKFFGLPRRKRFRTILCDPPWKFETWSKKGLGRAPKYATITLADLKKLPVGDLAARDCVLFMWGVWPMLPHALELIEAWGFKYKTAGFVWMKYSDAYVKLSVGTGYWTRANTEFCLLATRGHPKRIHRDVMQAILEPRREHSRKPPCVHGRIERLVYGPYLELFAREERRGWTTWGNEVGRFNK